MPSFTKNHQCNYQNDDKHDNDDNNAHLRILPPHFTTNPHGTGAKRTSLKKSKKMGFLKEVTWGRWGLIIDANHLQNLVKVVTCSPPSPAKTGTFPISLSNARRFYLSSRDVRYTENTGIETHIGISVYQYDFFFLGISVLPKFIGIQVLY